MVFIVLAIKFSVNIGDHYEKHTNYNLPQVYPSK
jgi:hypothetical protein